jgi:cytochrome c553/mono/diheme cytochrome c family protein
MNFRSIGIVVVLGLCGRHSISVAAEVTHPRIPGFERFYSASVEKPVGDDDEPIKLDPVTGGRILLSELNCLSCHLADEATKKLINPKQAPILDGIGHRVKVEWIRAYLASPHAARPGTTMPDVLSGLPEAARAASVEALTHFLASTGNIPEGHSNASAAHKGETLFRTVGCLGCHNAQTENAAEIPTSVILPEIGKKYSMPSLMAFLKDPLKSRPSGRMPTLGLSDEDYQNLAHYFVRGGEMTLNTKFQLFRGTWDKLPNFANLKVIAQGESAGFDLSVAGRPNNYGLRFTSNLQIAKEGEYQFSLGSDDGSRLIIDGETVADCDGIHPHQTVEGRKTLTAGFHEVVVEYFQGGGEASLEVEIAGQGFAQQPISGFLFLEPKVPARASDKPVFTIDAKLAEQGRSLFATVGCASCHSMKIDGKPIPSELQAKPLSDLVANSGCLADSVPRKAPRYGLTSTQRAALALGIKAQAVEATTESVHRTLATLNCYACHQRDKLGGVEPGRDGFFESRQKEMGDEGRLPPTLTGVGDKLRPDWLRQVLHHSAEDRKQYMVTKMPKFGPANIDSLVATLIAVDQKPDSLPKADFLEPDYRVKAAGRHLVGGQALSCIKCHDFGPHPSTGVRAINLATMTQRLRPEWFYRYVLDPQAYRKGTRMPAPWPFGQTTVRDVLRADVNLQVQAVWSYLSDRDKAAVPVGLVREPIELKPQNEPIIYRNFIEGAGSRAIGVGYPEGVNLAFDANNMRMAMIWHGAFIDASRHWTGRGQGFESPLGDDVLRLPNHVPFVKLDKPDREVSTESGRDLGYKFLGYRLDKEHRPIFRYSFGGLTVEDHPIPVKEDSKKYGTLQRTLHFEGASDTSQLWFRAVTSKQIESMGEGRYQIDEVWNIEVNLSGSESPIVPGPLVRGPVGQKELLIPIRVKNGKTEISIRYVW